MAGFTTTIREVLNLHRAQLAGIVDQRGAGRMRRIYDEARAELQAKLDSLVRSHRGDTFTAQHYRLMLAQIHDGIRVFAGRMEDHLEETGELAGTVAHRHLVREIQKFEGAFTGQTPVLRAEQVGVYRRIWSGVEPSLLTRYRKSVQLYGRPTIEAIHQGLAVSLAQGETLDQTVTRVAATDGIFAGERWRAERIARTEMAWSYHAVKLRSMEETAGEMPELRKTMVSTFDGREGRDSLEQNHQVRRVGEPFVYHVLDSHGQRTGKVIEYQAPPNRPNDRAVMIPWKTGWPTGSIGEPGDVEPSVPRE